jgi:hypothetical protein
VLFFFKSNIVSLDDEPGHKQRGGIRDAKKYSMRNRRLEALAVANELSVQRCVAAGPLRHNLWMLFGLSAQLKFSKTTPIPR